MWVSRLVIVVLCAIALSGCLRSYPLPFEPVDVEAPYRLDAGDKLRVVVFGQEGLSNSYSVDSSGRVTLPLIGAVSARGASTAELARAIGARLRQGFIREPHVAVEVETYRPFFVLGEVTTPGQFPYVPHMTVESAVAIAGGFTPRALRGPVAIDRRIDGALARGSVPLSYPVRPGDTIVVAERWF
jgi:polysaccharide biosynthesis/export protein